MFNVEHELSLTRQAELLSKAEQQFPLFWDPKISRNVTRLHPTVAQELRDLTSTYDVPLLDLRVAFDDPAYGRRQLFIDHVHLSALGSDVVARALLPVVERSLDLRAYRTRSR